MNRVTGAGGVLVLAVGEARQATIVAAVGAGRVGVVLAGQLPGDYAPARQALDALRLKCSMVNAGVVTSPL